MTTKASYNIGQVERDTGLSKDVLRVWERRYGFPLPARDANGERLYSAPDVDKLRVIKRLMDAGQRPGKLIPRSLEDLQALGAGHAVNREEAPAAFGDILALLRAHDVAGLDRQLSQYLLQQGLRQFVLTTLAPLTAVVGEGWLRGELAVFEEHLYTERIQRVLRAAIQQITLRAASPRILLTTLPQEQHALGLLMVESLLAADEVACVSLGTQTPVQDIVNGAHAHRADIVALSFSAAFPLRPAAAAVAAVRERLPKSIAVWVGGKLVTRLKNLPEGIVPISSLEGLAPALRAWHDTHSQ